MTKLRRAVAATISATCLVSSLFIGWWYLNLLVAVSCWGNLPQFQRAAQQAKRSMMILFVVGLILQVTGGIALQHSLSARRELILAFSSFTAASAVLIVIMRWPAAAPPLIWLLVGAVAAGSLFALRLQRAPARKALTVLLLK